MGYYIETGTNRNKASIICETRNGSLIPQPLSFKEVPNNKGLICVVDNGAFEAAGFVYDENQFKSWTLPKDTKT